MIKNISRFFLFLLALLFVVVGLAKIWPQVKKVNIPEFSLQSPQAAVLPDWTVEGTLKKINDYRTAQKLSPFSLNEKLTEAAKSRLSVMQEFSDYDGTQTGLTREKALDVVGYKYSWIGDLSLIDYFKNNDPIREWQANKNSDLTLKDKNLKEIGIALKQTNEQVSLYIVLATQAKVTTTTIKQAPLYNWGGPELWDAINKRRVQLGVNPLSQRDELCTIAAIRLNQILELGKLDEHQGFEPTLNRPDLKWISEKYNISEFLVSGYKTPQDSVAAWEDTLGHKKLLSGGEYVWGCVYAQNGFGVAIAAY